MKVVVSVVAVVALVALLSVANWERESRADEQSEGMREVLERVGALDGPDLNGFRIFTNFECLVYERGRNDFALEVCVDDEGRIVETIDRIDGTPEVFSLRDDPTRSEVRVDRSLVDALLERMMT